MKIALIGQKGIPASGGGVEKHVEELAVRMVALGHEVTVFCRDNYSSDKPNWFFGVKLKYSYAPNKKNLEAIVYSISSSFKCLLKDFDIVHYHALGPATASFIPKVFGKRVVVTVHGLDWQRAKWGRLAQTYLKFGEFASAHFPAQTIVVSKYLKEYYGKKYNIEPVYIPNGVVESAEEKEKEILKFNLKKDSYILFLARLTPEKGCHYLLDAFKELKTDKKLVIAGGSSNTDDYVNQLQKHASDRVIFTGNISGRLLREIFANCYIYVLPSEIEGLPISLLEAMSFSKCSLVSDIRENTDVISEDGIEKYGVSFKNKNSKDLKLKLEFLLNNQNEVNKKGSDAKKYVLNNYNWDSVVENTLKVYQKAIK